MTQLPAATLAAIWAAWLGWGIFQHRLPPLVLGLAAALNAATFIAYWLDKRAARARQWRIQESTLHLLALAGGWPAARLAQQVLRHKTIKPSFQTTYWVTVWLHLGALCGYITQVQLAETLAVSQQTVNAYEAGQRRVPVSMLPLLAHTLALSLEELIGEPPSPVARKRGPTPALQRHMERISALPKAQQKFVLQVLDSVLQQAH